jgi:hypothetical protein
MKPEEEDHRAMELLLKSNTLIAKLQKEMGKPGDGPDPEHIDGMVKSLYALEGRPLPGLSGEQLETAIQNIKNHSAKPKRRSFPKDTLRFVRWASAACVVLLFFVFLNLGLAWATGGCLLRKVDKTFCSHTIFCPADEESVPDSPSNREGRNSKSEAYKLSETVFS